jgi:glutamine amidotransferase-like uncharacterized protein
MTRRLALVYRGKASRPVGCSDAVAQLLANSRWNFDVRYVGPDGELPLTSDVLSQAAVYAQPGGGNLRPAYRQMRRFTGLLRDYVATGGRYLGFCLGGYLAGATPGFRLIPGDTDQYTATAGATVTTDRDTLVQVEWRGRPRWLYFQDGPVFDLHPSAEATVLARYSNGTIAAAVSRFGAGRVGVVGPHPEATVDWFTDVRLPVQRATDVGFDLIDEVMRSTLHRAGW